MIRDEKGNKVKGKVIGSLRTGEVAITKERLAELEAHERADLAYMRATQQMRRTAFGMYASDYHNMDDDYVAGWNAALKQFGEFVVEESRDG